MSRKKNTMAKKKTQKKQSKPQTKGKPKTANAAAVTLEGSLTSGKQDAASSKAALAPLPKKKATSTKASKKRATKGERSANGAEKREGLDHATVEAKPPGKKASGKASSAKKQASAPEISSATNGRQAGSRSQSRKRPKTESSARSTSSSPATAEKKRGSRSVAGSGRIEAEQDAAKREAAEDQSVSDGESVSFTDSPFADHGESDLSIEDPEQHATDDTLTSETEPEGLEAEPELSEEEENRRFLKGLLEALLFASDKPLTLRELARAAKLDRPRTRELLKEVLLEHQHSGISLIEIAGGYSFRSHPAYATYVQKMLAMRPVRLSRAQLETLAVIAYRQPATRPEVDDIRGVDTGQVIKGLMERDLIKILGKKDEPGRPMLYGTTDAFLELFSLESLKDLPSLREFTELNETSRATFESETGETAPEGPVEFEGDELTSAEGAADRDLSEDESTLGETGLDAAERAVATPEMPQEDEPAISDEDEDEDAT